MNALPNPRATRLQASGYTRLRRVKHAFSFIKGRARLGPFELERTQSLHVASTYGVERELVKRIKARFRSELSFSGEGK